MIQDLNTAKNNLMAFFIRFEALLVSLALFIFIGLRIMVNPDFELEMHFWGDSSKRALLAFHVVNGDFHWAMSAIWNPIHFILLSIPLLIYKSTVSIALFQIIMSSLSLIIYYILVRHYFNRSIAFLSFVFFGLTYQYIVISSSAMSEVLFILFIFICLLASADTKKTLTNFQYITATVFLSLAGLIRYEGFFLFFIVWPYLTWKHKKYNLSFIAPLTFFPIIYLYEHALYLYWGEWFLGLTRNPSDSSLVNAVTNGIANLSDTIVSIGHIHLENFGLFAILGAPVLLLHIYRRNINSFNLVALITVSMVYFGAVTEKIALFPRYFILLFSLMFPYGLLLLHKGLSSKHLTLKTSSAILFQLT